MRGNRGPQVKPPLVERVIMTEETVRHTVGMRWIKQQLGIDPDTTTKMTYMDSNHDDAEMDLDDERVDFVFTKVTTKTEIPT